MNQNTILCTPSDSIQILGLSHRSRRVLERAGVCLVQDLLKTTKAGKLAEIYQLGSNSVREIETALEGIKLVDEEINGLSKSQIQALIHLQQQSLYQQCQRQELHPGLILHDKSLLDWLAPNIEPEFKNYIMLLQIVSFRTVCSELSHFYKKLSDEDIKILIERYGLEAKTLEAIGKARQLTREAIRVRIQNASNHILQQLQLAQISRFQSLLLMSGEKGQSLSFKTWTNFIEESSIFGSFPPELSQYDPIELFIAFFQITKPKLQALRLSETIDQLIQLGYEQKHEIPVSDLSRKYTLTTDEIRIISRHEKFSGALSIEWLTQVLGEQEQNLIPTLRDLGYTRLEGTWFTSDRNKVDNLTTHQVFHHSLRKMFQYCGPLTLEDISSGLNKAVTKVKFPIPPTAILEKILRQYNYTQEGLYWFREGTLEEELTDPEAMILQELTPQNPVVHHAQLAELFDASHYSQPTLQATLKYSSVIENIQLGLYKLRGTNPAPSAVQHKLQHKKQKLNAVQYISEDSNELQLLITLSNGVIKTGSIISPLFPSSEDSWAVKASTYTSQCYFADSKLMLPQNILSNLKIRPGDQLFIRIDKTKKLIAISLIQ